MSSNIDTPRAPGCIYTGEEPCDNVCRNCEFFDETALSTDDEDDYDDDEDFDDDDTETNDENDDDWDDDDEDFEDDDSDDWDDDGPNVDMD